MYNDAFSSLSINRDVHKHPRFRILSVEEGTNRAGKLMRAELIISSKAIDIFFIELRIF